MDLFPASEARPHALGQSVVECRHDAGQLRALLVVELILHELVRRQEIEEVLGLLQRLVDFFELALGPRFALDADVFEQNLLGVPVGTPGLEVAYVFSQAWSWS